MYAFLNWQLFTVVLLALALLSLSWGVKIRAPFVASSPVRRGLKRARKRDLVTLMCLALALAANVLAAL